MKLIGLVIFATSQLVLSAPVSKPRAPMGNANGNGNGDGIGNADSFNIASNNFDRLAVGNGFVNLDTLVVKRQLVGNLDGNGNVGSNGNGDIGNANGNGNGDGIANANSVNIGSNNFDRPAVGNGLANLDTLIVKRQALVAENQNGNGNGIVGNNGNGHVGNANGNGNGEGLDNAKSVNIASNNNVDRPAVGNGPLNLINIVV
jgi:hypothetical protein